MRDKIDAAVDYVLSSKTLVFIFVMTLALILAFVGATLAVNLGAQIPVSSGELIDAWKWATGAGTARNVISDGVMPRVPQAVGAFHNPQVAVEPPRPMQAEQQPIAPLAPIAIDPATASYPSSVIPQ